MTEQNTKICWLASYPKSGNTWLRMFLASYALDGAVDINQLPLKFILSDNQPQAYQTVSSVPITNMPSEYVMQLRGAVLLKLMSMAQSPISFIKTHFFNGSVAGVSAIPTSLTAGAIYVVRDPRDVVISLSRHMGISIEEAADFMINENSVLRGGPNFEFGSNLYSGLRSWGMHVRSWALGGTPFPVHAIRYEDMLKRPEEIFEGVLNFLKTPVDKDRLEKAIKNSSFHTLRGKEDRDGFIESMGAGHKFFHTGKAGLWKTQLSSEIAKKIEDAFIPEMEVLCYGDDGALDLAA